MPAADLVHGPEELNFFASDGIVPRKQGELTERRLQTGDTQNQTVDAETALNRSIKQPGSYPEKDTVQLKLATHSIKPFPSLNPDTVRIGHREGQSRIRRGRWGATCRPRRFAQEGCSCPCRSRRSIAMLPPLLVGEDKVLAAGGLPDGYSFSHGATSL